MKRYVSVVTGLAVALAFGAAAEEATAQRDVQFGDAPGSYVAGRSILSYDEPPVSDDERFNGYVEDYASEGYYPAGRAYPDGYDYGYQCDCDRGGCECGDDCGYGYGGSWCDFFDCCGMFSAPGQASKWFFTADYLYVRSNFSDAIAYFDLDDEGLPTESIETFHSLDFRHESSYRFGGGYYLSCCDEQVRFNFTRLNSFAEEQMIAPSNSLPYEVVIPPGGEGEVDANVDVKSYDLEYAKTIPLGGPSCDSCQCGSACGDGCGDGCGACRCPLWDVTWSGGVRFADVQWQRGYVALDSDGLITQQAHPRMDFGGGGPRVGLEGRRYFGPQGSFSMFLKGDISLLLGTLNQTTVRITDPGGINESTITQSINSHQIIPVTEIEAGLAAKLTDGSNLSIGYLFSAWHDLGFRDDFDFLNTLETSYDDANILGFDGFFAHFEIAY